MNVCIFCNDGVSTVLISLNLQFGGRLSFGELLHWRRYFLQPIIKKQKISHTERELNLLVTDKTYSSRNDDLFSFAKTLRSIKNLYFIPP